MEIHLREARAMARPRIIRFLNMSRDRVQYDNPYALRVQEINRIQQSWLRGASNNQNDNLNRQNQKTQQVINGNNEPDSLQARQKIYEANDKMIDDFFEDYDAKKINSHNIELIK